MKRLRHYNKELAVVLSVFGSSEPSALEQYQMLKQEIKHALPPEAEVRMAISSRTVLKKLETYKTLAQELADIDRLGCKKVVVASINLFPTDEHETVLNITRGFDKHVSPARYAVTSPIFTKAQAANDYLTELDTDLRHEYGDINILYLAHGASNLSNTGTQSYFYVRDYLKILNQKNFFYTLEGLFKYEKEFLFGEIKKKEDLLLVPLLLVAGNHRLTDIQEIKENLEQDFKSVMVPENFTLLNIESTRKYFVDEVMEAIDCFI